MHQDEPKILAKLFDMPVEELVAAFFERPVLEYYRNVRLLYLKAETEKLELWLTSAPQKDHPSCLCHQLRLAIRRRSIDTKLLSAELPTQYRAWQAELEFLIAMSWEIIDQHKKAEQAYLRASNLYREMGAEKCCLTALHNKVAAASRAEPNRQFVPEYSAVYKQARLLGNRKVAGKALSNIAQEYENMGALRAALKYCTQAGKELSPEAGSINYGLVMAQKCHLLLKLGKQEKAWECYELASICPATEVRSALKVIKHKFEPEQSLEFSTKQLNFTWKHRMETSEKGGPYFRPNSLEEKLVTLLSERPQPKDEIIRYLYPGQENYISLENRFKSLLNRMRKKLPGIIVYFDDKYALAQNILGK